MIITRDKLREQFKNETGFDFAFSPFGYYSWIENLYIDKLNEEKELNDKLTEFMLQDGE